MKSRILLNWSPPAFFNIPSPSMSVLKQYLVSQGFSVDIKYWNMHLFQIQTEFIWTKDANFNDLISLYILYNYLSFKCDDINTRKHLKVFLMDLKPQYLNAGRYFFEEHMEKYYQKFECFLEDSINKMDINNILYWGLSVNLYQWVFSSILADKIKKIDPYQKVVIGGIGTKESAIAFLENFPQFDIALWGEGESSLYALSQSLKENPDKSDYSYISNIAYRSNGKVMTSSKPNTNYISLSSIEIRPDFSDYFDQLELYKIKTDTYIPLENSRSCHWKKCKFCYLNNGYKYRVKEIDCLIDEIKYNIEKYKILKFGFLDNDVIGIDLGRFDHLLDKLILLKEEYPDFSIVIAEIITNNIYGDLIKKMSLAGFKHVQIGYESASNNLLKKINKKNTFASNLLFIKFARNYNISIGGLNIIRNLLEEEDDDIFESIDNLHNLRFFLEKNIFQHNMSSLGVIYSSRYYKEIEKDLDKWTQNLMRTLLPSNYINNKYRTKIIEVFKPNFNDLWGQFEKMEYFYLKNNFNYKIIRNNDLIIYRELFNSDIINELEFDIDSLEWRILTYCNDFIRSSDEIVKGFKQSPVIIKRLIHELQNERLIYSNTDNSEIVTIINTNIMN